MNDINYLNRVQELREGHRQMSLHIQDKLNSISEELKQIFNKNKEFIETGLPFMKSVSIVVDNYLAAVLLDPNLFINDDPVIQYLNEGIFALCENWFISKDLNEEFLDSHFPREEFDKNTKFFKQFLKDNDIDTDRLSYWNYIY